MVGAATTTYVNLGLTTRTTYYYRVQAYNASGFSGVLECAYGDNT